LDEASESNRRASATLNVLPGIRRDGLIGLHPDRAGTHGDGGHRLDGLPATLRNEIGMHLDVVHVPRPDHQGILRV